MTAPRDLLRHEFIGLRCRVAKASNPALLKLEGVVIDETKNLLYIEVRGEAKKIPKKEVTLVFELEGKKFEIEGKRLVGRPEDRVKSR